MSAVLTEPSAGPAVTQEQVQRAPKVLLHDHLDGGLRPATIVELAAEVGHTAARSRRRVAGPVVHDDGRLRLAGEVPRDLRPHGRRDADRRRADAGGPRVRRGPGRGRRRLRRGPLRARAARLHRALPRRGRRRRAAGLRGGHGRPTTADHRAAAADRDAAPGPLARDRRALDRLARPRGRRLRHRRRRGRLSRPPGTSTRSSTSSARTPTSPSTPARRSGCRRSGRRSSGAAPTGSATACGSSTTSPSTDAGVGRARPARGVRPRHADPARDVPRLQRADRRRRRRSPSTRSACSPGCASGSRSTPTTG